MNDNDRFILSSRCKFDSDEIGDAYAAAKIALLKNDEADSQEEEK